jgi:hypothetical protein
MKLALPLGLIVAAATSLACSSDEGTDRNAGGTGGTGTGTAGSSTGGTGTGGTGTGGTGTGGTGTAGAAGSGSANYTYGAEYTITADGNVSDTATGVNGNTFLAQSMIMTVPAAEAHKEGALCFSGTTAVVPSAADYGTYWGAELGLNLKVRPVAGGAAPADAGADAGAVETEPDPAGWPYGNVIGFSYKLVGNNPAAADKGVPLSRIRFKALPVGSVGADDSYCANLQATADGKTENVLFSQIEFECWTGGNLALEGDQILVTQTTPVRVPVAKANPKALQNISWQIASDVIGTTPAPIAFDFCIEDLKPITGM